LTLYEQATAAMAAGDNIEAQLRFKEFLLQYPGYPGAYVNLAILHVDNGNDAAAREAVDAALALSPDYAPALNQLGMLHRRNGNFPAAESAYLKAVTVSPDYALAHYNLGVLNELSRSLTARLEVEQVLEEAHRGASQLLDATNFSLGLYNPEKEEISFPFVVTKSDIDREVIVIPASGGLNGYVVQNREPLLLRSPEEVISFHKAQGIEMIGESASIMAVLQSPSPEDLPAGGMKYWDGPDDADAELPPRARSRSLRPREPDHDALRRDRSRGRRGGGRGADR